MSVLLLNVCVLLMVIVAISPNFSNWIVEVLRAEQIEFGTRKVFNKCQL